MGTHLNCIDKSTQFKWYPQHIPLYRSRQKIFELHRQVDAIQMGIHNICLYKEVDKNYTGCNLKTTELLDCAFIGARAVIMSNTVFLIKTYPLEAHHRVASDKY